MMNEGHGMKQRTAALGWIVPLAHRDHENLSLVCTPWVAWSTEKERGTDEN